MFLIGFIHYYFTTDVASDQTMALIVLPGGLISGVVATVTKRQHTCTVHQNKVPLMAILCSFWVGIINGIWHVPGNG
mgnify:FL=1